MPLRGGAEYRDCSQGFPSLLVSCGLERLWDDFSDSDILPIQHTTDFQALIPSQVESFGAL